MPNPKKVYLYDLEGNFKLEYPSQSAAARALNVSQGNVNGAIDNRKILRNYQIRSTKSEKITPFARVDFTEKATFLIDPSGNLFFYRSRAEVSRKNPELKVSGVRCLASGHLATYKGWRLEENIEF